jgi:hypothetical protein
MDNTLIASFSILEILPSLAYCVHLAFLGVVIGLSAQVKLIVSLCLVIYPVNMGKFY